MNKFEIERERYRPANIVILFVAESRPERGTFFYFKDSNLYRVLLAAFQNVFQDINNSNFLEKFKEKGCYLEDLCIDPVNKLDDFSRNNARMKGIPILKIKLKKFNPSVVITLMKAISSYIDEAVEGANVPIAFRTTTSFPIRSRANIDKCISDVEVVIRKYLKQT
jgi:hypothetical protein